MTDRADDATPGAALVLLAGGSGQRSGHVTNKVLLPLGGHRVLIWSLAATAPVAGLRRTVIVVRETDRAAVADALAAEAPGREVTVVTGGATRHDSEWAGLLELAPDIRTGRVDVVVVHDAARPLASTELFRRVIAAARRHGGALPGRAVVGLVPATAPLRDAPDGRGDLVAVQTPQAFRAQPLLAAYEAAAGERFVGSDTASCIERFAALDIACLPGEATNIKITYAEDIDLAERLLATPGTHDGGSGPIRTA